MTRVLLAHHVDAHYDRPLMALIDRLQQDPRIDLTVEELWLFEYRASMAHALDACDYFVPVFSRHGSPWSTYSIWAIYAKHFQPRIESVVPITFDNSSAPWEFYRLQPLPLSIPTDDEYDRLLAVIATARSNILSRFSEVLRPQGGIIQVAADASRKLIRYFATNPEQLRTIDRREFEYLVAGIFREFGYETEVTARTRDGGRDVIAVRRAEVDVRFLIECKRPDPGGYVSVSAVRELLGVKHEERATKGILATTAHLSPEAKLFVERNWWELEAREYQDLVSWLTDVTAKAR